MPTRSKDKRSFLTSLMDCINGLEFVITNEENFRREIIIGIITIILSYILKISQTEYIIVLIMIALVLTSEVINTAIEKTVDLYTNKYNETAKIAKDVSAFAVLLMSIFALIIGIIIFGSKIINIIGG
ncbi:MAG: diacylglycerol kinase family protein [Bacilli bacterium]|nr:diacylglycerol kinase family protein [Bacilli bacterium]